MGTKNYYGAEGRGGDVLMFNPSVLKVRPDPQRPEKLEIDEEMVWSIMQKGVIEPLVISRDGGDVYVEAGRRRRAHTIEANRRRPGKEPILVPCIWGGGDEGDLAEKAVIENFHRQAPSPAGTAKAMQQLLDQGRTEERVRQLFGFKSLKSVHDYLAILQCAKPVQSAVNEGKLAASFAPRFAKLNRDEQVQLLEEMIAKGATKGQAAKKALENRKQGKDVESPKRMRPRAFVDRFLDALSRDGDSCSYDLVRFLLGDDGALSAWPVLMRAAEAAARKKAKPSAETDLLEQPATEGEPA